MANPRYEPRYNNQINIDYDNPARAGAKRMANFSSVPANPEDTSWQDCIRGWDASFVESPCITGNAGGAADIKLFFGAGYDGTDFDFYTGGVKDTATYVHADGWLIPADPIYNIILNDGTTFPCSEGAGNYLHTVDTAGVLLIEGTTSNVWDATQNFYHYNITSGYNKVSISNGTDDYIDTGIVPVDNENWYWEVKGRFNDLSTDSWNGSFETNERFYWGSIPAGV